MSDQGLQEAIRAAGGVTELARRIGISQPSVSNWSQVPAERVLSVEAATGVARAILRPDLYGEQRGALDDVDAARAQEYALLAVAAGARPNAALLKRIARLRGDATPLGAGACRAGPGRRRRRAPRRSGANFSISSSASGAASCCPTAPII